MKYLIFLSIASCSLTAQAANLQKSEPLSENASIRITSIDQLAQLQKKVCSAHYVASHKIYLKGEAASDKEKSDFVLAAKELVRLQAFIVRNSYFFSVAISDRGERAKVEPYLQKHLEVLKSFEIKADLPATKKELNEGGQFANRLSGMMSLPLSFFPLEGDY
jgi:hypothetical protein